MHNNKGGNMKILQKIALALTIIGALNWGLVGIFNWNLVEVIFGGLNTGASIIYILVLIAGIWLLIAPWMNNGRFTLTKNDRD